MSSENTAFNLRGSMLESEETQASVAKTSADFDLESSSEGATGPDSEKANSSAEQPVDPNVVDWDGPDDPENPLNWPASIRIGHVVMVSIITLIVYVLHSFSPDTVNNCFRNLGSTMFAPGAGVLMADFHQTSSTIGTLAVSIYLLGFALGPLFVAPMSEFFGRLVIYHVCNGLFLAFTIGCALSTNIGMFLGFRFITGCAGSAPLTIGGGTIADVIPQQSRGKAMGLFAVGPLLGPVIGPVMGGFVAQDLGWRWTFWIMAIIVGSLWRFCRCLFLTAFFIVPVWCYLHHSSDLHARNLRRGSFEAQDCPPPQRNRKSRVGFQK